MALIDPLQALTLHDAHLLQPGLELRRRPQTQHLAHVQRIVEGSALVVEHDVVGAGDTHGWFLRGASARKVRKTAGLEGKFAQLTVCRAGDILLIG